MLLKLLLRGILSGWVIALTAGCSGSSEDVGVIVTDLVQSSAENSATEVSADDSADSTADNSVSANNSAGNDNNNETENASVVGEQTNDESQGNTSQENASGENGSQSENSNSSSVTAVLDLPFQPYDYSGINWPAHFSNNNFPRDYDFQNAATDNISLARDNAVSDHGATLGRVLFYDSRLSADGTISCSSCHVQKNGFSDPRRLSLGVFGGQTRRHSMALANSILYQSGRFFWDESAASLEDQVLFPIQNPAEMGLTLNELVDIAESQTYYPPLFKSAFGSEQISAERIAKALAQFVRSMVSFNARYDQARGAVASPLEPFPGFSAAENRGKELFFDKEASKVPCASCHVSEAFVSPFRGHPVASGSTTATSNGLDAVSFFDLGVFESTFNPADIGKFKAPSLRNIEVTQPYMHDGRFSSLEDVVNHYSSGVQNSPGLPDLMRVDRAVFRYNFSVQDKSALVAFLRTLTDNTFLNDARFSDPFRVNR